VSNALSYPFSVHGNKRRVKPKNLLH